MISEWMINGNINQYVKAHPEADRMELVRLVCNLVRLLQRLKNLQLTGVAKGLIYLHSDGMIHGDLKGVCSISLELLYRLDKSIHQG